MKYYTQQKGGRRHKKSCRGGRKTRRGGRKTHRRTGGQTASQNLASSQWMNEQAAEDMDNIIAGV